MGQNQYKLNSEWISVPDTDAGCDEAGRGCLAGPVVAAAVILGADFDLSRVADSKQLSAKARERARLYIEENAAAYSVCSCSNEEIDRINILQASIKAMHGAVDLLALIPPRLWIDGHYFNPHPSIPHTCVVGGDAKVACIAAASILAKTYRDALMRVYHVRYPQYGWDVNKGYPTNAHRSSMGQHGVSPLHRRSFRYQIKQLELDFGD